MKRGKVYLIGAGPGDPDLLTIKAANVLREVDVVVYDRLISDKILDLVPSRAERIYVGKLPEGGAKLQEEINKLLVKLAREGKVVARVKGGDPMVFGRGGEEAEALADAEVEFEIVPGVTSAIAAPAYAGIPVTDRRYSSSIAIVTGHEAAGKERLVDLEGLAKSADTLVVLMGIGTLPIIVDRLLKAGKDPTTPVAIVERGTTSKQKTIVGTLSSIVAKARETGVSAPAIIVVGEVVRLREKLRWFE